MTGQQLGMDELTPLVGTDFQMQLADGRELRGVLREVSESPYELPEVCQRRRALSLLFEPLEGEPLDQQPCRFRHQQLEPFEALIVPVVTKAGTRAIEVVFS